MDNLSDNLLLVSIGDALMAVAVVVVVVVVLSPLPSLIASWELLGVGSTVCLRHRFRGRNDLKSFERFRDCWNQNN